MKYLYGLAILCCLVLWSSCRNDFETVASSGNLEFSRDTVYLDTVFTNIGSSTYNLKVYNRSDEDINIPTVRLGEGEQSNYRLNVDGLPGKVFNDVQILAKDSIFIFVETTFDINSPPISDLQFLYTDQILFDAGSQEQKVELVTLVKDASFLFPADLGNGMFETLNLGVDENGDDILIEGFILDDTELHFTNEKPYVIYGYAGVAPGKTLTIDAGARIHFHATSGILVGNTGSIQVNGAPSVDPEAMENEVIFEGDRLEPDYTDVPGQWGTIWLTEGSMNNRMTNTTIKNSVVGILSEGNDGDPNTNELELTNVQIYNSSNVGLLARNGHILGENMVINNSGQTSLSCSYGGIYEFNHCTFANYWTNSFRSFPSVQVDNFLPISDTQVLLADLQADFNNCIIYGNEMRELGISIIDDPSVTWNYNFRNSLIRFEDPTGEFDDDPFYMFETNPSFINYVLNVEPSFQETNFNNFNIEKDVTGAEGIGNPLYGPVIDLNGTTRVNPPDAGAYESIVFPD
ncbi:hypothetical protein [Ulvibacter antarcticus]|uniref:Parallel beta helix pectate lyase-like protein n=1 Tax=Ulvibacter antarcticus TaxID=442714 RepID=A0A3L9Z0F8_9FLAO|nr:hypothetical protein [Ulvibacter antarcticus]RMA64859.1 hypothetical protein BXY75_1744 [Ulvibacter antarcticus]